MASVGQKVPARVLISLGLTLVGAGLALLTIVGAGSSWWLFLPGLLVAMVGTGMLNPAVAQVALGSVAPEQSGLAAGVNDMFRQAADLRRRPARRAVGGRGAGGRVRARDRAVDSVPGAPEQVGEAGAGPGE